MEDENIFRIKTFAEVWPEKLVWKLITTLDYAKASMIIEYEMNKDNSITNEMFNLKLLLNNKLINTHNNPQKPMTISNQTFS